MIPSEQSPFMQKPRGLFSISSSIFGNEMTSQNHLFMAQSVNIKPLKVSGQFQYGTMLCVCIKASQGTSVGAMSRDAWTTRPFFE